MGGNDGDVSRAYDTSFEGGGGSWLMGSNGSCRVASCCVMLCHVVSCCVMLCHVACLRHDGSINHPSGSHLK